MSDHYEGRPRSDSSDIAYRKIFIGGLSYSTDEEKLKKYFKNFGPVQDAVVMKDPVSKRSRGFGFITFYDINSVDNVLANEPHTIDARKVEAKRAVPRSEMNTKEQNTTTKPAVPTTPQSSARPSTPQNSPQVTTTTAKTADGNSPEAKEKSDTKVEDYAYNKVFVGGLHYDTRDPDFRAYFERYGRVVSAEVMFNRETHKSRGFGFIVFELEDSAIKVCSEKEHIIDGKVVEVKRAIPRSKIVSSNSNSQLNMLSPPGVTVSSLPASNPGSAVKATSPTENASPNAAANIRSDVRRTLSAGNASMLLAPPSFLPGNSSSPTNSGILSLKPPQINVSNSNLNNNNSQLPPSGAKKAQTPNTATAATTTTPSASTGNKGSYAAALKLGASLDEAQLQHHQQQGFLNTSNLGSGLDSFNMNLSSHSGIQSNHPSNSNLQSLLQSVSREFDVRQSRALSEPIKFDNSFAFSHDMFDLNSLRYGNNSGSAAGIGAGLAFPNTGATNGTATPGLSTAFSSENLSHLQHVGIGFSSSSGGAPSGNTTTASFSWLGSPNKFDSILDPTNGNQQQQNDFIMTRNRAHSLGPTTLASASRSPAFSLGYSNYHSFSHDHTLVSESIPQSPAAIDRQFPLAYNNQSSTTIGEKNVLFSTPSRVGGPVGLETPQSALSAASLMKQKSPAPTNEWGNMLHSPTASDNHSNSLIAGSLLGLIGENNSNEVGGSGSLFADSLLGSDASGSRILSISKSNSTQDFISTQRRHSHPILPSQDIYDASRFNELNGNNLNNVAVDPNSSLWRR